MSTLATTTSAVLRKVNARLLSTRARILGKGFLCESLRGQSPISVCVTSDLKVSCGYRDLDGTGRVADLSKGPLEDAFYGPTAIEFREQLAAGRLPTPNCIRCWHLRTVARSDAAKLQHEVELPSCVMVENTSACNLRCTSCARATIRRIRGRRTMSLDDVRNVAQQLKRLGVTEVAYLHLGEPFLSKRLGEELQIIREYNPGIRIHTSTNGMFVGTETQRKAALLFDHIQFSLDGINQEMADRYQRGIDFDKSFSNMKELVRFRDAQDHRRTHIVWKYLLFRWNESRRHLLTALDMARDAGVDEIWFERTVSPFYGLPWRTYLGFNRDLGIERGNATHVVFREEAEDLHEATEHVEDVALVESLV